MTEEQHSGVRTETTRVRTNSYQVPFLLVTPLKSSPGCLLQFRSLHQRSGKLQIPSVAFGSDCIRYPRLCYFENVICQVQSGKSRYGLELRTVVTLEMRR